MKILEATELKKGCVVIMVPFFEDEDITDKIEVDGIKIKKPYFSVSKWSECFSRPTTRSILVTNNIIDTKCKIFKFL